MLTFDDNPTIRHAILKRLDKEPNVKVVDIVIRDCTEPPPTGMLSSLVELLALRKAHVPHIEVGVWLFLTDTIRKDGEGMVDLRSFFDLPAQFELRHVHNEIDEIAEAAKKAREKTAVTRLVHVPGLQHKREQLEGTGLRGRWLA
jgi:hypothetical protein